ncbi:SDR family NAD(P)-dependent oxidoreductase, partial [Leptospira interrogans serovar Pomona]|uniref:SDR family NAD(P)-dependent oxidoreductase n=1 Tax=Leptospira interrogans TaxID=173 RepID=UPI00187EE3A3
AKRGASVILSARNEKTLKTTVEELREIGHKNAIFDFAIADVSEPKQVQKAAKKTLKALNGLDLLICNSGYAKVGKLGDLNESDFHQLMDVNFFGHVNLIRAFQEHFLKQKYGDIVL